MCFRKRCTNWIICMRDIYFFFQQNLMVWNRIKSQKGWHSAEGHPAAQASAPTNAHRADLCKEVSLVKAISPWEATLPFHRGIWEWHITCTWFSCYLSNKNKYLTGMWHATSTAMACAHGHDANRKKSLKKYPKHFMPCWVGIMCLFYVF